MFHSFEEDARQDAEAAANKEKTELLKKLRNEADLILSDPHGESRITDFMVSLIDKIDALKLG